ncbi:MAG: hypothetical protein V8R40_06355 [Dysosmobacter sp.]
MAYRIGEDSSLLRQSLLLQTQGGLLSVSDREAPLIQDPEKLSAAVLRECGRRGYTGVLLDFEEPPRQDRQLFAQRLEQSLTASRRTLYVPETYIRAAPGARMLLCTALSGGTFTQHLQEVAEQLGGAARIWRWTSSGCGWTSSPPPSGEGTPLSQETLETLMEEESPAYFSPRICAPATSPTPETARPTSSSSTTPIPCRKSCEPAPLWAFPRPFLCFRRSGTLPPAVSPEMRKNVPYRMVQHVFYINNSASCSCERPQTSCGA